MKQNKIELIDIEKLHVNPENPRTIKDQAFKDLMKSIQNFPDMLQIRTIVVNEDLMIIGGEKRYLAAKELGHLQVPVIIAKGLTKQQQDEFILLDNHHAGTWDVLKLADSFSLDLIQNTGLDYLFKEKKQPAVTFSVNKDGKKTLKFKLTEEEYDIVITKLNEIGGSLEFALLKLLTDQ